MNTKQRATALLALVMSLIISGCGSGQMFAPTVTSTITPTTTPTITPTPTPISKPDIETVLLANGFLHYPDGDVHVTVNEINPYQYYQYCGGSNQPQPCPRGNSKALVGDLFAYVYDDGSLVLKTWTTSDEDNKVTAKVLQGLYPDDVIQWINSQIESINSESPHTKLYDNKQTYMGGYIINIRYYNGLFAHVEIGISTHPTSPMLGHYVGYSPDVSFELTSDGVKGFQLVSGNCIVTIDGVMPLTEESGEYGFNMNKDPVADNIIRGMFIDKKAVGSYWGNGCSGPWRAELATP